MNETTKAAAGLQEQLRRDWYRMGARDILESLAKQDGEGARWVNEQLSALMKQFDANAAASGLVDAFMTTPARLAAVADKGAPFDEALAIADDCYTREERLAEDEADSLNDEAKLRGVA